ncbi:MAG: BamA/TamA family outer membrane protein [Sphingomonas sp.]|uniref:BamA/TamA family outer membrane protein n=1 Tax=Sphingomonas sp. TaxID=28214 RepID=UPI001ACF0048|nr:BamA/TamA family outer membrane protein [Sphingomonas sp.]MBN8807749.1 BamA/TamA family outer membrane protein [Sphingomonas sp.]
MAVPATGQAAPTPTPTSTEAAPQQSKPVAIPTPATDPQGSTPVIDDKDFNAALPKLSNDINAPLEPIPQEAPFTPQTAATPPASTVPPVTPAPNVAPGTLPPVAEPPAELAQPLPPLDPNVKPNDVADTVADKAAEVRYDTAVVGLDKLGLEGSFKSLSSLKKGGGKAANKAMVSARAREDEALAIRLMKAQGYYDGSAISTIEPVPTDKTRLRVTVNATPGPLYRFGTVTIDSGPVVPTDLIVKNLNLNPGDPIEADRVQGAEANVSLQLGQTGYPFSRLGTRDILLDDKTFTGDYTLPVDLGPRSRFGDVVVTGRPFNAKHVRVLRRFKPGDLYDTRLTDDLRKALVATSMYSTVSVAPVDTGRNNPDGTRIVDIAVDQTIGKTRSVSGTAGYSTGQGFRAEGTFTARNAFPPEGAFVGTLIGGTQEQGASVTFRRSNWLQRDRTLTLSLAAGHSNYDAFNANTIQLIGRVSYDSTPIWQKKFTYYYGFELTGTNETAYDFATMDRQRGTYFIAALPVMGQFDTSDDLLNPTRGYRVKLSLSPETSVRGAARPYLRSLAEASAYYPVSTSLVLAGRVRVGSIVGIERDDLAPSRRYYGGGGGSVRGYGYQRLGPFDPNGDPVGGRSLNEFALEARYRFGNFGIVPFLDGGNSYASSMPKFNDWRLGAGIGGRFYTNFGPIRIDVATPLNRRPGDSRIALYISIGQAF